MPGMSNNKKPQNQSSSLKWSNPISLLIKFNTWLDKDSVAEPWTPVNEMLEESDVQDEIKRVRESFKKQKQVS